MFRLFTFETDWITGMTEGEHSAPLLTPVVSGSAQFRTETYFYRGAEGQVGGPGLFLRLPPQFWPSPATPLYVLLNPDVDN